MKQSLQLQVGQSLNLTPQLQQAIRLLQLSAMDLQQEIQNTIESNVMLEVDEELDNIDNNVELINEPINEVEYKELNQNIANLSSNEWPVDSDWTDFYDSYTLSGSGNRQNEEYNGDAIVQKAHIETLRDYLAWQSNIAHFSDIELIIATAIIDAINEDGYLTCTLEDILSGIKYPDLTVIEITNVLKKIQEFDPPGVGARNLQECLLLQLTQLPQDTPFLHCAITICEHHLNLLSNHNFFAIKELLSISEQKFQSIMSLLRMLHPFPGATVVKTVPEYVIPDVLVNRKGGKWYVELNPEITPHLRVNADYAKLIRRTDRSADNLYLKNHLQEARWFIKNLSNRNETLLRVATTIVELQRGFFEHGPEAMRPMVLRDVAEALSMHESTISRVTTQKYLHSPRGTFELKFFFPSHVNTGDGGQCSATAIRAIIKKLVASERPEAPLSDDALAKILAGQGIQVARRTITKYRESMSILPSIARKRQL